MLVKVVPRRFVGPIEIDQNPGSQHKLKSFSSNSLESLLVLIDGPVRIPNLLLEAVSHLSHDVLDRVPDLVKHTPLARNLVRRVGRDTRHEPARLCARRVQKQTLFVVSQCLVVFALRVSFGRKCRQLTALIDSLSRPGRLNRNFDFSKTPSVERSLDALTAVSRTGRKTWSARWPATGNQYVRRDKWKVLVWADTGVAMLGGNRGMTQFGLAGDRDFQLVQARPSYLALTLKQLLELVCPMVGIVAEKALIHVAIHD